MRSHVWSFVERLTPRLVAAGLILALAVLTNPHQLGLYSWATLSYTAFLAVTEAPARQVLAEAVTSTGGRKELGRFRVLLTAGGTTAMAMAVSLISYATDSGFGLVGELSPICLTPACIALGLEAVGRLQVAGKWNVLARSQMIAALVSGSLSIPILLATHSVFAAAVQGASTELCFALLCRREARGITPPETGSSSDLRGAYRAMAVYSGISWSQAQADRVFVGAFGGPALLGAYSVSVALSRSLGDALAAASANLLRAELASAGKNADVRGISDRILRRSVWLGLGAAALSWMIAEFVARPLLGTAWAEALSAVPILAIAVIPSCLAWSSTVLQVRERTAMRAIFAPLVGVLFAPVIGASAIYDLRYAACLVVLREFCLVLTAFVVVRRIAPWGALRMCAYTSASLGAAYALIQR